MVTGSIHSPNHLLSQLANNTWLIRPDRFMLMQNMLQLKLTDEQMEKLLSLNRDPGAVYGRYQAIPHQQIGNKLVVDLNGTFIPNGSWFASWFDMIGYDGVQNLVHDVTDDPSIDHVIFKINSPGGTAIGCWETAAKLNELRAVKRVTTLCTGNLYSAAYLLGSCADEIYSTSKVNDVGSIGVVATHMDQSRLDEQMGIKITYIAAGKYKTLGNPHEPLSEDSKTELMRGIELTYNEFKSTVQLNRNFKEEKIGEVADGRVFAASEAVENGLIDGIESLENILSWEGAA